MKKSAVAAVSTGLIALLVAGVWYGQYREPAQTPSVAAWSTAKPASSAVARPSMAASEPGLERPVALPAVVASATELDVESVLTELVGRKSTLSMFQLDDFARRVVATVDNLGRSHAASRLWPVNPAKGRFMTETHGDVEVISADNGLRYTPYVLLIETVNLREVAAAYARLYPLFQQAYEALGYPNRQFNDRVLDVLDQLIATPDVESPIAVRLPAINGPMQPLRPWVLYEFADPELQSLSAGQKILLRAGPVNERRLKSKLAELRRLLGTVAASQ